MPYEFHHVLNRNDPHREAIFNSTIARLNILPADVSWSITVERLKVERTEKQRRTMFGLLYKTIMDHCGLRGSHAKDVLHDYWCKEYFGTVQTAVGVPVAARTTTEDEDGKRDVISVADQIDFYEFVQQRVAAFGCIVPDPDPFWREKAVKDAAARADQEDA